MALACPYPVLLVSLLLALPIIQGPRVDKVVYSVTNNALHTPGGKIFRESFSDDQKANNLTKLAANFVWDRVLHQPHSSDRKEVKEIRLIIDILPGFPLGRALENGVHEVHINANHIHYIYESEKKKYVEEGEPFKFVPFVIFEVRWMLTLGIAQNLQWRQDGDECKALRFGIAAFAVLKARFEPPRWARAGEGKSWDEKYDITGQFFFYISQTKPRFVADLNDKMKTNSYTPSYFKDVTGKTIEDWWSMYKKDYQKE